MSRKYHNYSGKDHTFVVCAYQESAYLEECIKSLEEQTSKSMIIIATSTPNDYIQDIADKHGLSVYVNTGEKGLSGDWNYAYDVARKQSKLVTIAHQDDVYLRDYAANVIREFNYTKKPLIAFTDYGELRNEQTVLSNRLLTVKKMLLFPLRVKAFHKSKFIRRRILSMGSAICCPSVSFYTPNLPDKLFTPEFRSNSDWQAWERLSKREGEFVYIHKPLMLHRIHEESTTTQIISDNNRSWEDIEMFKKFWPAPIAGFIEKFYIKSEKSNDV